MTLTYRVQFLGVDLTPVVDRIDGLAKRLMTLEAFEALTPFAGFTILMSFRMAALRAFHWVFPRCLLGLMMQHTLPWFTTDESSRLW